MLKYILYVLVFCCVVVCCGGFRFERLATAAPALTPLATAAAPAPAPATTTAAAAAASPATTPTATLQRKHHIWISMYCKREAVLPIR